MDEVVFHIIESDVWDAAKPAGSYVPDRYDVEGFIHLSGKHQVLRPANLLYQGRADLLLLGINVRELSAELRYEPGSHGEEELYPHLYGPLNTDAVREVYDFPCSPDGSFELPAKLR